MPGSEITDERLAEIENERMFHSDPDSRDLSALARECLRLRAIESAAREAGDAKMIVCRSFGGGSTLGLDDNLMPVQVEVPLEHDPTCEGCALRAALAAPPVEPFDADGTLAAEVAAMSDEEVAEHTARLRKKLGVVGGIMRSPTKGESR